MKSRKVSDLYSGLLFSPRTERKTRYRGDSAEITLEPTFIQAMWAEWKNVIIISVDSYAIIGLRHILASRGGIHLRVLHGLTEHEYWSETDAVIWVRERFDNMPELAGEILKVRRVYPDIRQLVISDFLPAGLINQNDTPLNGITLARAKDSVEILRKKVAELFTMKSKKEKLLGKLLSPGEWRVLYLIAAGVKVEDVAEMNGTATNTVLAQRTQAMARLGIKNRAEFAFVLRCIQQMQQIMPAIWRTVPTIRKRSKV